jgi:hypothetical protein
MAAEDERLEIAPERAVEVRETRTLLRLAPAADNDLGRSNRQIAIVAADTEEEARQIASMHDAFRRDWRDPRFAVCDALQNHKIIGVGYDTTAEALLQSELLPSQYEPAHVYIRQQR